MVAAESAHVPRVLRSSLVVGWRPAKEAWTGDDHESSVDEPDVDDDWRGGQETLLSENVDVGPRRLFLV